MWYTKSLGEVKRDLRTNFDYGLTEEEVTRRQEISGPNRLKEKKKESFFIKFIKQFNDFMIIILIIASIISALVSYFEGSGDYFDSIIIIAIVIFNSLMGVIQEAKAEKSIEALQKMTAPTAKVRRSGKIQEIDAIELVPGDIIILESGNFVPADCRLIKSFNLKIEEASLTGENVPATKDANVVLKNECNLGDMVNMAFSSCIVTSGNAEGVVTDIGMNTKVGQIAKMIIEDKAPETPIQKKLAGVGKTLGIACLVICVFIFIIGLFKKISPLEMFMTSVGLAVAAIPEGLPAIVTIMLSIGVTKMARKNAIIRKLPAVETLGSSGVICSDKTGTLTQNKMTVKKAFWNKKLIDIENIKMDNEIFQLLNNAILCNDSKILEDGSLTGDPTETALTEVAFKFNFDSSVYSDMPRIAEVPFDSDRKLMTTIHKVADNLYRVYTKGGIDELLRICKGYEIDGELRTDLENYKVEINSANEEMAKNALRVLGFAYKEMDHKPDKEELENIENDLIFIGMLGMIDPPREEAKHAVEKCKTAGIKTVMITGDHKITAMAIAKQLGILENENEALTGEELEKISDEELTKNIRKYSVYARVSPEHKVRIVKAWQANGEIVAMTGDGVNDSPALKTADIGCAMGNVGTEVAKEAADVILTDDNFATIVSAVEEGRRIYDNILKVIQFLISSNIGEVIVLFVATLLTPLLAKWCGVTDVELIEVLLPIHILWVNLVTDSLPALALAFDPADKEIMKRKPLKPSKGVFTKGMTYRVVYQGIMVGLLTLAAFIIGMATTKTPIEGLTLDESKVEVGQTMAFITLSVGELAHVFNVRNNKKTIFSKELFNNKKLLINTGISLVLVLVILFIPALRHIFSIPLLPKDNIIELIILVLMPIVIVEIFKMLKINTFKDE